MVSVDLQARIHDFYANPQPCVMSVGCPRTNEHSDGKRHFLHPDMAPVCEVHHAEYHAQLATRKLTLERM